ncbi:aromatic acid exporter family protein, partial [Streptomyces decoyicus]|uniref:aromatic acid exporter family protein n=1 Tax=Streptomyces decoyicus TaxID=249567 RepID=UPI0033B4951E
MRGDSAQQGRPARSAQWWRRAWGSEGHERHTALLIGKGTVAATLAWVLAHNVLHAQSPAFAPFSAVLIMQVTVYQSLLQSTRYVGAVAAGMTVQAALGFLGGPDLLTFALVALAALTIGRWPALGSQGSEVPIAAFFAFSTY